jgi:hypothetical protein
VTDQRAKPGQSSHHQRIAMGSGSDDLKTNIEHRTEEKEVIG